MLSTNLRKKKRFTRFTPEGASIHNPESYLLENDGTKITDRTSSWATFRTDCVVNWGETIYFEVTLEKISTFFVIGLSPLKNIRYDNCVFDMRYYSLDSAHSNEYQLLVPGTRVGILYDTPNNEAILFWNGEERKQLCDMKEWQNKEEPCTIVVAFALGGTTMQINNDAVVPRR
jgi:hypothetical protein